jgi:carboxymethylenebutenolidase
MNYKLILIAVSTSIALQLNAQNKSCCSISTADDMAQFAFDNNFVKKHLNPLPFKYSGIGEMINFKTTDGKDANGFAIKSSNKSNKFLFVYQEWWGLNDHIKKECEKLYTDLAGEVTILAIDLYDEEVAEDKETASKLMQNVNNDRCESIINGAIMYVGKDAKIASIGWCFGGGWSLKSALLEGEQAVGCVMYYGMPVNEIEKLKKLKCDVLGIFADKDQWINKEVVIAFETNMRASKKLLEQKTFQADHAFANPSNPQFDQKLTDEAYMLSLNYLKNSFLK